MGYQHEPLHEQSRQEAAEDRVEPTRPVRYPTLADLSPLECEALAFLRREARLLWLFSDGAAFSNRLKKHLADVEAGLLNKRLIERCPPLDGFVRLTIEGERVQAELFAEDGK